MVKIHRDGKGLYAYVGGWVARPQSDTLFKDGNTIDSHHFRGTSCIGMGKLKGRNKYKEMWLIINSETVEDHKKGKK